MPDLEADARRALNRLQRAVHKARRELDALRSAAARVDADELPEAAYDEAAAALDGISGLTSAEGTRFQERILRGGGLHPGRVRGPGRD